MTRTASPPRWRRTLVIAATVFLSTGAAAAAASTPSSTPAEAPTTSAPASPGTDLVDPIPTTVPVADAPTSVDSTTVAPTEVATSPSVVVADEATTTSAPVAESAPELAPAPPATPVAEAPASAEGGEGQDGPTVTVNGQPFKGQADPKLEGCSIVLSVTGLAEGSHAVVGAIQAGEEPPVTLVSFDTTFDGTSWTDTWALDDLVGGLDQKPNGYHITVVLKIDDGASLQSRPFWLACGAAQDGNPFVIVFDKQWQSADGTVLDGPPAGLPADWSLTATSKLGTATCTYPQGSDQLVCQYDNKGAHQGATDGLYVPGGKKHTYSVAESTPPAGWSLVSGTGTFSPRDLCPRGDDGHHEEEVAAADEPGQAACLHLVVNRRDQVPTTTTTTTTTTPSTSTTVAPATTPTVPGSGVEGADVSQPGDSTLVRTGSDSLPLVVAGLVLLAGGVVALGGRRWAVRQRSVPRS